MATGLFGRDSLLAAVIGASLDAVVVIDTDSVVIEWNPAAAEIFGWSRAEAIGTALDELIIPQGHHAAHRNGMARYLGGGEPRVLNRRVEVPACRKDGTTIPVELAVTEVQIDGRRLFTASLRDLTELKRTRAELERSEARLNAFFGNAPVAMFLLNVDGTYERVNVVAADALGTTSDAMIGKRPADVVPEEDARSVVDMIGRVVATGQSEVTERRYSLPTGEVHTLIAQFPIGDEEGKITHTGAVAIDISDRVRAERLLRDSEARMHAFLDHAPMAMYLKNRDGRYFIANRFMADRLGRSVEELKTLTPRDVLSPASWAESQEVDAEIVRTGQPHVRESEFQTPTGLISALTIRFPVFDDHGELAYIGGVILDTSAQREAEQELQRSREALLQSEKMNALGSLLAGVSHELNNPLAIVVGEAVLLQEEAEGTEYESSAARIQRAAERCSRIVQTFLAMARQKAPERRPTDLAKLVRDALELAEYGLRSNGVDVQCDLGADLPFVFIDPDQVTQIILNLVVNAQQALQNQPLPRRLNIRAMMAEPDRVTVEIADNGPGVSDKIARRIFDPFFTTKPQGSGTGIGLSFSQGIAEAHGGSLVLAPSSEGAAFRLELPVASAVHEPVNATQPAPKSGTRQVLIVDDEPELAETMARLLRRQGLEADVAVGGIAGRDRLLARDYDVILSDLRMPDFDGPSLYHWILEERPHLAERIAFVTGDTLGPAAVQFLQESGRPALEKPFTRESVNDLLERLSG